MMKYGRGMEAPSPVILFDGECGLCNRVVRTLLRWDRKGRLRFSPLQGYLGQEFLRSHGLPTKEFSTLIYVPDWERRERPEFKVRSSAVVAALFQGGEITAVVGGLLWIIPRPIRDWGYRAMGNLRYKIWGPWKACPLPRPEWRTRILE